MAKRIGELFDISRFETPDEIEIIQSFVRDKYQITPQVSVHDAQIIITVSSAALAGTLRMHLHELTKACQTKKRLVIRIS